MSWILVKNLGNTSLDPRVRVFFVRSSRMLGLCRRSRGLIGIGSGVGWVSGMADRRRDDRGSALSMEACVQVQTWEREGNRRRNCSRLDPSTRSFLLDDRSFLYGLTDDSAAASVLSRRWASRSRSGPALYRRKPAVVPGSMRILRLPFDCDLLARSLRRNRYDHCRNQCDDCFHCQHAAS